MKNEGLLHCKFLLSLHLARPREVRVEIYNVKVLHFFTKCWDLLDLSQEKKLLDLNYIYPGGMREAMPLFFG